MKKIIYELKMQSILAVIFLILCYVICKIGATIQNNSKLAIIPFCIMIIEFLREEIKND